MTLTLQNLAVHFDVRFRFPKLIDGGGFKFSDAFAKIETLVGVSISSVFRFINFIRFYFDLFYLINKNIAYTV